MVSIWGERIAAVLCAAFAFYMMSLAWSFPAGGNLFPVFACIAIIVTSSLMLVRTVVSPDVFDMPFQPKVTRNQLAPIIATVATVVYVWAIFQVGYYTSTLIYLVAFTLAIGIRDFKAIAITAVLTLPLMYVFFELFLQAGMPTGWLI